MRRRTPKLTCIGCGRRKPADDKWLCDWCDKRATASSYSTDEEALKPVVFPSVAGVPGGVVGAVIATVAERMGHRTLRVNGVERTTMELKMNGLLEFAQEACKRMLDKDKPKP